MGSITISYIHKNYQQHAGIYLISIFYIYILYLYLYLYLYTYPHTGIQDFPGHFGPHRLAESTPTESSVKVFRPGVPSGWAVPVVPWPRCNGAAVLGWKKLRKFGENNMTKGKNNMTKGSVKLTIDETGCSFRKFGDLPEICNSCTEEETP